MRRTLRNAALAAVALLSLSGCLKMEMAFTLHEDDTVDGSVIMAIQKGIGESFDMSDEDVLAQMESEGSFSDIEGGTTEPYDDGEYVGQKVTFEAQPLGELEQQEAGFTIVREGDEFVVGGEFDTGEEDMSMLGGADVSLSVTFPGPVSEHNGTLEGTTVTWDLLTMTEPLNARGAASAGGSVPWLWIGLGAAALLIIAGAAIAIVVVRKRGAAQPTDAAATYPAATYPAPTDGAAPYQPEAFAPAPEAFTPATEGAPAAPAAPEPTEEFAAPTPAEPLPDAPTEEKPGEQEFPPPSYPPQNPPTQQ